CRGEAGGKIRPIIAASGPIGAGSLTTAPGDDVCRDASASPPRLPCSVIDPTDVCMLVISIQSQVVHGHVGNSAAVPAMQAEGVNVAAVPTTLLSNHPRYPTLRGRVLETELVADLLKGVEERDLVDKAAVLVTGYLGSPGNAAVIADFVERALTRNSKLVY